MKYKLSDFLNLKTATIGAIMMGSIVYYVNMDFGFNLAIVAALKQATYTFFFGGACVRLAEVTATRTSNKWLGVVLSTFITSCVSIAAVYTVHVLKGTPLPFYSTLPTIILGPPGFFALALLYRNKVDKQKEQNQLDILDEVEITEEQGEAKNLVYKNK